MWPVQCSTSSAASFTARLGSPAFPKMVSTKSRLLTKLPGAKKRTSILFSLTIPGTSGHTTGRSNNDTITLAFSSCAEVKGKVINSSVGFSALCNRCAKVIFGTSFLSAGTGSPPRTIWNVPFVVRLSAAGLFKTPCFKRYELSKSLLNSLSFGGRLSSRAIFF